jgi:hypothetical protein
VTNDSLQISLCLLKIVRIWDGEKKMMFSTVAGSKGNSSMYPTQKLELGLSTSLQHGKIQFMCIIYIYIIYIYISVICVYTQYISNCAMTGTGFCLSKHGSWQNMSHVSVIFPFLDLYSVLGFPSHDDTVSGLPDIFVPGYRRQAEATMTACNRASVWRPRLAPATVSKMKRL